jgi:hypothetical protein
MRGISAQPEKMYKYFAMMRFLATLLGLGWGLLCAHAQGATPEQMQSLQGARFLDARLNEVFRACGLPAVIVDHGRSVSAAKDVAWKGARMRLTQGDWDSVYARGKLAPSPAIGWVNPAAAGPACRGDLAQLVLHAKGGVGFLSVKRKPRGEGYVTTYRLSGDAYRDHQIIGVTAIPGSGIRVADVTGKYGQADEEIRQSAGRVLYRYWIARYEKDHQPVALYALDFDCGGDEGICSTYSIGTVGYDFVREKLHELVFKWEREYVLD